MSDIPLAYFMRSTLEKDIYTWLEERYLKDNFIFNNILGPDTYKIPGNGRIDYKATDLDGNDVFIEVKPWEISIKHVLQVIKYYLHVKPNKFYKNPRFIIIGKTITNQKRELLEKIGIEVKLIDEIAKV